MNMNLIKKFVNWLEDWLWKRAIRDVFENLEYYEDGEENGRI